MLGGVGWVSAWVQGLGGDRTVGSTRTDCGCEFWGYKDHLPAHLVSMAPDGAGSYVVGVLVVGIGMRNVD